MVDDDPIMKGIPEPIRQFRIFLSRINLRNPIMEFRIRLSQDKLLKMNFSSNSKKLIVFLTVGYDIITGGIISISSICTESKKLKHVHGSEVLMCTVPNESPLLKYSKFDNQIYIFTLPQILSYFENLTYLMIHIPEYAVTKFVKYLSGGNCMKLREIEKLHFNIMIQNIKLIPPLEDINYLKEFGKVTCTTAHEAYLNPEIRKQLGIPMHRLSTYLSPEQYTKKRYFEKENLMIISHDHHAKKAEILYLIREQLPQIELQIIKHLTYEDYKMLISGAKWALTFGEGLDGYFIETVFSGGISFAVFNDDFFTDDFKKLQTVYDSYETLEQNIISDIKSFDNESTYEDYQNKQYDLCSKYYDFKKYIMNLQLFYEEKYTYE